MSLSFRTSPNFTVSDQEETTAEASISVTALDFVSALTTSKFDLHSSGHLGLDNVAVRVAGRGGYATIEIGTVPWPRKHLVAVKRTLIPSESLPHGLQDSKGALGRSFEQLVRELRILSHEQVRRHANIVNLEGVCMDDFNGSTSLDLVMEYSKFGPLRTFLVENSGTVSADQRIDFVLQAGRGLDALHRLRVCHADVKVENALVFKSSGERNGTCWTVKISDFGQSVIASRDTPDGRVPCRPGTRLLEAPEIRRGQAFHDPCYDIQAALRTDVFSFGLFAWEVMKNGQRYFDSTWIRPSAHQLDTDTMEDFLNRLPDGALLSYAEDFTKKFQQQHLAGRLSRLFEGTLRDHPQARKSMSELVEALQHSSEECEENNVVSDSPSRSDIEAALATLGFGVDQVSESSIASWGTRSSLYDLLYQGILLGRHNIVSDLPITLQRRILAELKKMALSNSTETYSSGHSAMTTSECYTIGFGGSHDMGQVVQWLGVAASSGLKKAGLWYHRVCHAVGLPPQHITGTDEGKAMEMFLENTPTEKYLIERILYHNGSVIEAARQSVLRPPSRHVGHAAESLPLMEDISLSIFNDAEIDKLLPLHIASWLGEEALVVQLLKSTPPDAKSALGFNAAHFACLGGHLSVLEVLIKHKVPLSVADFRSVTPLHFSIFFSPDDLASAVHLLVEHGCSLEAHTRGVNWEAHDLLMHGTPLQWAIQARNRALVRILLPLQAKSPNLVWLTNAIEDFYWEILEDLLPYFKDVPDLGSEDLTTLQTASRPFLHWITHGRDHAQAIERTVQLCNDNGFLGFAADGTSHLSILLSNTKTAGDLLLFNAALSVSSAEYVRYREPGPYTYPLIVTVLQQTAHKEAFHDTIARLADYYNLDELQDDRLSPNGSLLGVAVYNDNTMGARILLERGVDVNKSYSIGHVRSAIIKNPTQQCLLQRGSPEMLSLLVEYGADLLAKDPMTGLTPLHSLLVGRIQVNDVLNILLKHHQPDQVYIEALHKSFGNLLLRSIEHRSSPSPGAQRNKEPQLRRDLQEQFRQLLMHPRFVRYIDSPQHESGANMIQQAAFLLHVPIVQLLLDAGADAGRPFRCGSNSVLPLQLVCMIGRGMQAMDQAGMDELPELPQLPGLGYSSTDRAMEAAMETATQLLQWHLARNDGLFEGITELHIACRMVDEKAILKWLQQGKSMKAKGRWPGVEHKVTPRELVVLPVEENMEALVSFLIPNIDDEVPGPEVVEVLQGPRPEIDWSEDESSVDAEDLEY
ncbi:hypothetical protein FDECE_1539 [Fusarium decemcellulare]|nr:hypothetical protein FDECE_1539 [Fusarium decemcellulare]